MTGADTQVQQTQRKTKVGRVVSDKMDKTIVVSVERLARHPLYKRVIRLTTKFKAHDEENDAHTGDTVLIEESRPLSATKRWRLIEVVARASEHGSSSDVVFEEAETTEAIHAAAHPGRTRTDEDAENPATSSASGSDRSGEDADRLGGDADRSDEATTPAADDSAAAAAEDDDADRSEGGPA
jgi:small subunit ribosomal protein S17